jgi:signal transduction histidine kinase
VLAIAAVAAAAVVLFVIPLGIVLQRTYRDDELLRLQRDTIASTRAVDLGAGNGDPVELPRSRDALAVYDLAGRRIAGRGPGVADAVVRQALRAHSPAERAAGGGLLVAVPLLNAERVVGAVRAERSDAAATSDAHRAWLILAGGGAALIALAVIAALLLGRRLVAPLDRLAAAARRLGEGDFTARAPRAGVEELDAVADALDSTAARLDDLLARERAFSADASHQLRTPLAALRIELEALELRGRDVRAALDQVDRLQQTIETLLAVARDRPRPAVTCELVALLTETEQRWRGPLADSARRLTLSLPSTNVAVRAGDRVIGEILDVLLDNATRHGDGAVSIALRTIDEHWAEITVSDQGPGFTTDEQTAFHRRSTSTDGHGIGLALARSLAHAEGGRLTITSAGPAPRIALVLPRSNA